MSYTLETTGELFMVEKVYGSHIVMRKKPKKRKLQKLLLKRLQPLKRLQLRRLQKRKLQQRKLQQQKKRQRKLKEERRKGDVAKLKEQTQFKAALYNKMKAVSTLLDDDDISCVKIEVPDKLLSYFTASMYSEDLAEYNIEQGESANEFFIKRKYVNI